MIVPLFAQSDDDAAILQEIRERALAQIGKTSNYNCVQTAERDYYQPNEPGPSGCLGALALEGKRAKVAHDRLRMDIAVSEGREIYAWHGQKRFDTGDIDEVVQSGPVTSGGFNGFLSNIFRGRGIEFKHVRSSASGIEVFTYNVPLDKSTYATKVKGVAKSLPFHGSFSADANTFELETLDIVAEAFPPGAQICNAETSIHYQIRHIAQHDLLIPKYFELQTEDETHTYTITRSEYSGCREYSGESTLSFDYSDKASSPTQLPQKELSLPAHLDLKIALATQIDSKTAYTGDAVQGLVMNRVKVAGTQELIPAGAILEGVITKLEQHFKPKPYFFLEIKFNHLSFSDRSYRFSGHRLKTGDQIGKLKKMYGNEVSMKELQAVNQSLGDALIIAEAHLQIGAKFLGYWATD